MAEQIYEIIQKLLVDATLSMGFSHENICCFSKIKGKVLMLD